MNGARRDDLASEAVLLALEADRRLRRDPRMLLDPRRIGALHASLRDALGEDCAATTLLQAGFLQGLRDALSTLDAGFSAPLRSEAGVPVAPRLPLVLEPGPRAAAQELDGMWRESVEAEGHLAALGPERQPCCHASTGYASGWLTGLLGVDVLAVETACVAAGAPACRFRARPAEAWAADGEAGDALARMDFAPLRTCLAREPASAPERSPDEATEAFDPEAPVIHVWGPVMIVPFGGADEALRALELIGRDEQARDVSVVVLDLGGAIVDDGFGASALEQILDAIESWGADTLLTGVAPLSEPVIRELETRRLLVHKDLPDAIATAFQIADAQRRVY